MCLPLSGKPDFIVLNWSSISNCCSFELPLQHQGVISNLLEQVSQETHYPDRQDALLTTKKSFHRQQHTCSLLFSSILCVDLELNGPTGEACVLMQEAATILFTLHSQPLGWCPCPTPFLHVIFMVSPNALVTSWADSMQSLMRWLPY